MRTSDLPMLIWEARVPIEPSEFHPCTRNLLPGLQMSDHILSQDLAASHRPYNPKRLSPCHDRIGQGDINRLMRQILSAGKEPDERPPLLRDVIANRPPEHGIRRLQRVQD